MFYFPNDIQAEAVIFDFDGVIVDTEPIHYRSFQQVLKPLGLSFTWQEYIDTYIGFDDRDAFKEAFRTIHRELDDSVLKNLIRTKAEVFQEVIKSGVPAYAGVIDLVQQLFSKGIPLAICSGALKSDIEPILDQLQISDCFNIIITAEDVPASKPDPQCYQLAFARLADQYHLLSKAGTLAIEDTPAGITSARGAGLRVLAVTNSYTVDHLSEATYTTDSLTSLLDNKTHGIC